MARRPGSSAGPVVLVTVLALAFAAAMLWPVLAGLGSGSSSDADDPVTVTSYDARYVVAADGTLTAVETITAAFPYGRHGIFRYWDVADTADPHVRYVPQIEAVTRDGTP